MENHWEYNRPILIVIGCSMVPLFAVLLLHIGSLKGHLETRFSLRVLRLFVNEHFRASSFQLEPINIEPLLCPVSVALTAMRFRDS